MEQLSGITKSVSPLFMTNTSYNQITSSIADRDDLISFAAVSLSSIIEDFMNFINANKKIRFQSESDQEHITSFFDTNNEACLLFKSFITSTEKNIPELNEIVCSYFDKDKIRMVVHSRQLDGLMTQIDMIRSGYHSNKNYKHFHLTTDYLSE